MRNARKVSPRRFVIVFIALSVMAALPLISRAKSSTSINIVNNSTREIRHIYLSPVDADTWSENQLGDSVISAGNSFTLNDVSCDQPEIKVIGEDQNGCFLSTVVACGGNGSWTITNDTAADCGGN